MELNEMVQIERCIERSYPYISGVLVSILLSSYFYDIILGANKYNLSINALFSSAVNVSVILTGFLFTFYGLAIAPSGGFIQKIFKTKTFRLFTQYVLEALAIGLIVTLVSIPFVAASFNKMVELNIFWKVSASVWLALFTASLLSFWRVARVYFFWVKASSKGDN